MAAVHAPDGWRRGNRRRRASFWPPARYCRAPKAISLCCTLPKAEPAIVFRALEGSPAGDLPPLEAESFRRPGRDRRAKSGEPDRSELYAFAQAKRRANVRAARVTPLSLKRRRTLKPRRTVLAARSCARVLPTATSSSKSTRLREMEGGEAPKGEIRGNVSENETLVNEKVTRL